MERDPLIHIGGVASHLLPIHDGLSQIPHKAFLGSTHTTCFDVSSETKTGAQDVNRPEKWDEVFKFENIISDQPENWEKW